MKAWMTKALALLMASLEPPKHDPANPKNKSKKFAEYVPFWA